MQPAVQFIGVSLLCKYAKNHIFIYLSIILTAFYITSVKYYMRRTTLGVVHHVQE